MIGVFDSGSGGRSVATAIKRALPGQKVLFRDDTSHLPYGDKTPEQLQVFVLPILRDMATAGCNVIVIACNTVTTTIITELRNQIDVPLVGIEPMIKTAADLTKSGVIAVCATPTTLSSNRYAQLKASYAAGVTVLEPDCSDWASMVQDNNLNESLIAERINEVCDKGADVIVLGCTHYHWIEDDINKLAEGRAVVIQPEQAIIAELKRVLSSLKS